MFTEVLLGVVLATLLFKYFSQRRYKLPPGPTGLPFFGNVFALDKKAPHDTMTRWAEYYGDVFKIKMFGNDFVILNSFETMHEALVTKSTDFAGRPPSYRYKLTNWFCDDIISTTYSRKWVFLKKITLQTLKVHGEAFEKLEFISLEMIRHLLEELNQDATKGAIEIGPAIHECVTGIIISILYDKIPSKENVERLLVSMKKGASLLAPANLGVLLDVFPPSRFILRKTFSNLLAARERNELLFSKDIKERKEHHEPGNPRCLLDGLFDQQLKDEVEDGEFRLTDREMFGISSNLVYAGVVTTSTTCQGLIAILINKPDIQKRMADDIIKVLGNREPHLTDRLSLPYVEAAILEVLRYMTIVPLNLPHYTTKDTSINGYDIPKDTRVMFNLWKLHHDPEYWEDPWEFKPERFLDGDGKLVAADHVNRKRLFAFGAGRRVCVGERLARNRLFLLVISLIQHFEFLPAGPDLLPEHDPRTYNDGMSLMPQPYLVKLVPRLTVV